MKVGRPEAGLTRISTVLYSSNDRLVEAATSYFMNHRHIQLFPVPTIHPFQCIQLPIGGTFTVAFVDLETAYQSREPWQTGGMEQFAESAKEKGAALIYLEQHEGIDRLVLPQWGEGMGREYWATPRVLGNVPSLEKPKSWSAVERALDENYGLPALQELELRKRHLSALENAARKLANSLQGKMRSAFPNYH